MIWKKYYWMVQTKKATLPWVVYVESCDNDKQLEYTVKSYNHKKTPPHLHEEWMFKYINNVTQACKEIIHLK